MKTKILKSLLFLLLLSSCKENLDKKEVNKEKIEIHKKDNTEINLNSKQSLDEFRAEEGTKFLNKFYSKFYFDENATYEYSDMKSFLSAEIDNKINQLSSDSDNLVLDYDPFIQGQDFSGENIKKSLNIVEKDKVFVVSFIIFENEKVIIEYKLIKDKDGKIKIDKILSDPNFKD